MAEPIASDEELQDLVDRAFIKHTGKTHRIDQETKQPVDSLAQIEHDFQHLFGGGKD